MPGVQLDGIAKAMLPRLPSREWRLLGETNDGFGSESSRRLNDSVRPSPAVKGSNPVFSNGHSKDVSS
jgi:hypothetical protein